MLIPRLVLSAFLAQRGGIEIGTDVVTGQLIRFHSENHVFSDTKTLIREQGVTHQGIKLGDNVWIGAGATFLDRAHVGPGCDIAANAAVTSGDYPSNSVMTGVPSRVINKRNSRSAEFGEICE